MKVLFSKVIQNMSTLTFLPRINNKLEDISIQKDKVLKLTKMLDTKKVPGCDQILVPMIKICGSFIVDPLCMIFEKCLRTGIYPPS